MSAHLENWYVKPADHYRAPEICGIVLTGTVSGHPKFADGEKITTSEVAEPSVGMEVRTVSRTYTLGTPSPKWLAWMREQGIEFDPLQPIRLIGGAK